MSLQFEPKFGLVSFDSMFSQKEEKSTNKYTSIPRTLSDYNVQLLGVQKSALVAFPFQYSGISKSILGGDVHYIQCGFGNRVIGPADSGVVARFKVISHFVLNGGFSQLLARGKNCMNPDLDDMGECALQIDLMSECACPYMSRITHPAFRETYEAKVVEHALAIAKQKKSLTMTFFAPGLLATEISLFIKLMDRLKKEKWKGQLNLQFIDYKYGTPALVTERETLNKEIERLQTQMTTTRVTMGVAAATFLIGGVVAGMSCKEPKRRCSFIAGGLLVAVALEVISESMCRGWDFEVKPLRRRRTKDKTPITTLVMRSREHKNDTRASQAIPQFLTYVQLSLSQEIEVKARFFSDAENYISLCAGDGKFNSDLLVGVDFPGAMDVFKKLREKAQTPDGTAVAFSHEPNPANTQSRVSLSEAGPGGQFVELESVVVNRFA